MSFNLISAGRDRHRDPPEAGNLSAVGLTLGNAGRGSSHVQGELRLSQLSFLRVWQVPSCTETCSTHWAGFTTPEWARYNIGSLTLSPCLAELVQQCECCSSPPPLPLGLCFPVVVFQEASPILLGEQEQPSALGFWRVRFSSGQFSLSREKLPAPLQKGSLFFPTQMHLSHLHQTLMAAECPVELTWSQGVQVKSTCGSPHPAVSSSKMRVICSLQDLAVSYVRLMGCATSPPAPQQTHSIQHRSSEQRAATLAACWKVLLPLRKMCEFAIQQSWRWLCPP